MALRLIQKKNDTTGVTVDIDALSHFKSFHDQDGSLYGFVLTLSSGKVMASKGVLSVHGFLFENISDSVLYDLSSYSTSSATTRILYLILTYDASTRDTSFEFEIRSSASGISTDDIQQNVSGSYYYELCRFIKNGSSITSFTSSVQQISLGASSGGTGIQVPQPNIAVVFDDNEPAWKSAKIKLWNVNAYFDLKNRYKVVLRFARRLQKGVYAQGRTHYFNTHWAMDSMNWGLKSSPERTHFDGYFNISAGDYPSNGIDILAIEKALFFVQNGSDKYELDPETVDTYPTTAYIRATRSKVYKRNGTNIYKIKHNFVEVAMYVEVYDPQSNRLLATSAMSKTLSLIPVRFTDGNTVKRRIVVKME